MFTAYFSLSIIFFNGCDLKTKIGKGTSGKSPQGTTPTRSTQKPQVKTNFSAIPP